MIPTNIEIQIIEIIKKIPSINQVLLFGSRVYGDYDERSDVDIALVAPHLSEGEWLMVSLAIEEELDTLLKIDLVHWEKASEHLKTEISACNHVLYDRNG